MTPTASPSYTNDNDAGSCTELVESITDGQLTNDSNFDDVEDGYDIETG